MSDYYVLGKEGEPVLIDQGYEPGYGDILVLAVYTSKDGGQQREDLQRYKGTEVLPISAEDLLTIMDHNVPTSVFFDGRKLAGSVFKAKIKSELGLPIKHPRLVNLEYYDEDVPDLSEQAKGEEAP